MRPETRPPIPRQRAGPGSHTNLQQGRGLDLVLQVHVGGQYVLVVHGRTVELCKGQKGRDMALLGGHLVVVQRRRQIGLFLLVEAPHDLAQ